MLCSEIIQVIEASYPKSAALGFDNVGLLVGRADKETDKVYLAVDATDAVIDHAIAAGAGMLITHHPLIFSPMKRNWKTSAGKAGSSKSGYIIPFRDPGTISRRMTDRFLWKKTTI